jgi:hypothetical protein
VELSPLFFSLVILLFYGGKISDLRHYFEVSAQLYPGHSPEAGPEAGTLSATLSS